MSRHTDETPGEAGERAARDDARGNDRIAKAEFIREEMTQTGCLAIEAAERFDSITAGFAPGAPARLLCDCVTGRHGRRPKAGHDMGCATGLGG